MYPKLLIVAAIGAALSVACGSSSSGGSSASLPSVTVDGSGADSAASFGKDSSTGSDTGSTSQPDIAQPDIACIPNCAASGAKCGPDGCGGQCGFCNDNWACVTGVCKELASPDACAKVKCDANANCIVGTSGAAECKCKQFWTGDGKSCVDTNECLSKNGGCDANALCTNQPGAEPTCACIKGFNGNGIKCFDDDECKAVPAPCTQHAACNNTPGSFECVCDSGFSGTTVCQDIDECATGKAKCGAKQACENLIGSYSCICPAGYTKSASDCKDIDECATASAQCSPNATCSNTSGGYTCACKAGFTGDGKVCTENDVCLTVSCSPTAQCQKDPATGKGVCVCLPGYQGDGSTCTPAVVNITLQGAWLAPTKSGGVCWDLSMTGACVAPSKDKIDAVTAAMASLNTAFVAPGTAALSKMAAVQSALGALGGGETRPDAYGTAELNNGGGSFPLATQADNYMPSWSNVNWTKVSLDKTTELKITLMDADLFLDEDVGSVALKSDVLAKALQLGDTVAIPVYTQSDQVLAIVVKVTAWVGCGDGKCASPETAATCPADCSTTGPKCGDGTCATGETATSCPTDCKAPAGTCSGVCGKEATTGACWCDDLCATNGDCCADYMAACAVGCQDMCGKESHDAKGSTCWCDDYCATNGDCCTDKAKFCP